MDYYMNRRAILQKIFPGMWQFRGKGIWMATKSTVLMLECSQTTSSQILNLFFACIILVPPIHALPRTFLGLAQLCNIKLSNSHYFLNLYLSEKYKSMDSRKSNYTNCDNVQINIVDKFLIMFSSYKRLNVSRDCWCWPDCRILNCGYTLGVIGVGESNNSITQSLFAWQCNRYIPEFI